MSNSHWLCSGEVENVQKIYRYRYNYVYRRLMENDVNMADHFAVQESASYSNGQALSLLLVPESDAKDRFISSTVVFIVGSLILVSSA